MLDENDELCDEQPFFGLRKSMISQKLQLFYNEVIRNMIY